MNRPFDSALPLATRPLPAAGASDAVTREQVHGEEAWSAELPRLLAQLLRDEAALYAITRDWRFDVDGRKFTRLHRLLDEQFTEIGLWLGALAAHSRALELHLSTGQGDRVARSHAAVDDDALEAHIVRELLHLHEALLGDLRTGRCLSERFHDSRTTDLLAGVIAQHEKDVSLLRVMLSQVPNPA